MAAKHGSNADVYGNGYVLSEFLNSASFSGSRDSADTTTFKKKSKTYIPGPKDTTMGLEGLFDGVADAVDEIMWAAMGSSVTGLYSYIPQGNEVIGGPVFSVEAIQSSYEVTSDVGDVSQISAELSAGSNGYITRGKVAVPMSVQGAAGNSQTIDGEALSSFGASLVVHTTASVNLVLKLQDSADNVTFADLPGTLTFTAGRGSKRLYVPGNIRRYTRVLWTGTGTFFAAIDRFVSAQ